MDSINKIKFLVLINLVLFLIASNIQVASGERILVLIFFCSKSMRNIFDPLLEELANRGHELTIVSPIKATFNHSNARYLYGMDPLKAVDLSFENPYEKRSRGEIVQQLRLFPFTELICRSHYDVPEVKELRHEKFDLVITNGLVNECVFGLLYHFKAPYIAISTIVSPFWLSRSFGAPTPPSFVPLHVVPLADKMSFFERVYNFLRVAEFEWTRLTYYNPRVEAIYRDYYPDTPSVSEISSNYSLILMNTHPTLNYARPNLPGMVEIGGIHCRPAQPLPKDLEEFIQSSGEHGFILFSFGSLVRGSDMPERFRLAFIKTFAKLKQKVLWKYESESMPHLPSNVKLVKWLPQQDLLGHPKIHLFITHGGLLSTQETVYHGVPLLGIPFFADQDLNMRQAEYHGYGLVLQLGDVSEETLTSTITTLLTNDKYHGKAKYLSNIFRDQLGNPLERAVYWTEYVIRHKGAPHLRSAGRDLNFFQYHSLDVAGVILTILTLVLLVLYLVIRKVLSCLCGLVFKKNIERTKSAGEAKKRR